ncbi:MAG: DNA polymerase III subunit chi [Pseudomonadota bacterium]
MGDIRFYHLTERPLEDVLPVMLERSLERGWRVTVRGTAAERITALDARLWTYRDESFLPHGAERDGADQPVWLTTSDRLANDPNTLMLIDGAEASDAELAQMETTAILFDGHDPEAVEHARDQWRRATKTAQKAVYWAQEGGRWVKKAES